MKSLHRYWFLKISALLIMFAYGMGVYAQQPGNQAKDFLKIALKGYLVVQTIDAQGRTIETFQDLPDLVPPGSLIQYEITAFNSSKGCPCTDTLKGLALLGYIPEGTIYVAQSATQGYEVAFSIDKGAHFQPWPVLYTVRLADGSEVQKIATPDMITQIRWTIDLLAPQKSIIVHYRVQVPK